MLMMQKTLPIMDHYDDWGEKNTEIFHSFFDCYSRKIQDRSI